MKSVSIEYLSIVQLCYDTASIGDEGGIPYACPPFLCPYSSDLLRAWVECTAAISVGGLGCAVTISVGGVSCAAVISVGGLGCAAAISVGGVNCAASISVAGLGCTAVFFLQWQTIWSRWRI